MKYYRNDKTKEMVSEIDAVEYELDDLGITITPKGKNGEFTQDQIVVMEELIFNWFYDSDWKTIYLEEDDGEEIY
jgi:hypothetical protein